MDWVVGLVSYLETHPGVGALLEVVTIGLLLAVYRGSRRGRAKLHTRVDTVQEKLSERIDGMQTQFAEHEKRDERVLGRASRVRWGASRIR